MRTMHEAGEIVRVLFRHTSVLPLARLVLGVHLLSWAFATVKHLPEHVVVGCNGPWLLDGQAVFAFKPNCTTINLNLVHFEIFNQSFDTTFSPVLALSRPLDGDCTPLTMTLVSYLFKVRPDSFPFELVVAQPFHATGVSSVDPLPR